MLKGKHISYCILLASEGINLLENRNFGGNVAIKFDVAKVFDTLNLTFLTNVLTAFGFHEEFIKWVGAILASAHLSILFNGSLVGFFGCCRGNVRGIRFLPYFFVLLKRF